MYVFTFPLLSVLQGPRPAVWVLRWRCSGRMEEVEGQEEAMEEVVAADLEEGTIETGASDEQRSIVSNTLSILY